MPGDVIEVSDELYEQIFTEHAMGKIITSNSDGNPIAIDPPTLSGNALIKHEIAELEATITLRHIREAVLGLDKESLTDINAKIITLREKLT